MSLSIDLKTVAAVTTLSLLLHAGDANAVLAQHRYSSNAVNYCQAFTPGPSNTIRNRVIGSENIGTVPVAVACSMMTTSNGDALAAPPHRLEAFFSNRTAASMSVTCTMLTGHDGESNAYAVNKTTTVPAAGRSSVSWTQADHPLGASTLGNDQIGFNCTLPPNMIITDIYMYWNQDNGVL